MGKTFKKVAVQADDPAPSPADPRPSAAEVLAAARGTGLPSATASAPTGPGGEDDGPVGQLNLRFRESVLTQLARRADEQGETVKLIVARALAKDGIDIPASDLENKAKHRRRR